MPHFSHEQFAQYILPTVPCLFALTSVLGERSLVFIVCDNGVASALQVHILMCFLIDECCCVFHKDTRIKLFVLPMFCLLHLFTPCLFLGWSVR
jgi:hypothetical protein